MASHRRKTFKKGMTLLEVYADSNSRLREMVLKLGGKAERFTREDGDLSTVEGQRKFLQLIHRIKPEHVWMAPKCGPWGSWSRFNANRSPTGFQSRASFPTTQSKIRKLHINLGRPTSEKLATHLAAMGAPSEMIAGAKDFLCPSRVERRPPSLHTPGKLRDAKDFNDKVEIDGFYWKNRLGIGGYVLHIIDECTHFHLGRRSQRDTQQSIRWCGPAQVVLHESRTIIWITHLNRLLRCSKENLRPVSLREFESHRTFIQPNDPTKMKEMAEQLTRNLKERSGMFQFSDLTDLDRNPEAEEAVSDPEAADPQPEEEPNRRMSDPGLAQFELELQRAQSTPVPETPLESEEGSNQEEIRSPVSSHPSICPTTPEHAEEVPQEPIELDFAETIYNASIIEPGEDGVYLQGDSETIWDSPVETTFNACSFEFEMPKRQLLKCIKNPAMHETYLTSAAKKSHAEVKYHQLNSKEQELFNEAKTKELKCWLETSTVKRILKDRIHPSRIMSSRWVLTWKTDETSPLGHKAKARLVVRGYQDPELHQVDTDSPTLSRDAVYAFDPDRILNEVANSELRQKKLLSSEVVRMAVSWQCIDPVPEPRKMMNLGSHEVCLLEGNAYGRVDAPVLFYKEFRRRLEKVGFEARPLDNCLYLLRNKSNPEKLDGILGTHVDDGIGGGNHVYDQALAELQKHLPFGSREYDRFRFTGLDIEQLPDFSIKISQQDYVNRIEPIDIPEPRRSNKDDKVNNFELQALRGLRGSLQYAAVHSRPDIATKVAFLQKSIPTATVDTLMEANRVLKEAKDFGHTAIFVRPIPMSEVTFASFGDASFASSQQRKAQQGNFIMACTEELAKNETTDSHQ